MMNNFPKWIIEDGLLKLAICKYHKQLASDPKKVIGGGWFFYEKESKSFVLYGSSHDFGSITKEEFEKCELYTKRGTFKRKGLVVKFTIAQSLEEAMMIDKYLLKTS